MVLNDSMEKAYRSHGIDVRR